MKALQEITNALKTIRSHREAAENAASQLSTEIGKIDSRFSPEIIKDKTAELKAKFTPTIIENLRKVSDLNDELRPTTPFWESRSFVLSQRPITRSENPADEAVVRLSRMTEYSKMPLATLELHLQATKAGGVPKQGELYLVHLEHSSRAGQPGWEPFSIDDVELPDRQEALTMLNEAKATQTAIENIWRGAERGSVLPTERMTAARAEGA